MGNRHTLFTAKFVYGKSPYIKSKVKCVFTFHITADVRNNLFSVLIIRFSILLLYWKKYIHTSTKELNHVLKYQTLCSQCWKMVRWYLFYVWCFVLFGAPSTLAKRCNFDQREICCMAKHPISNSSNVVKTFRQTHTNLIDVLHSFNLLWTKLFTILLCVLQSWIFTALHSSCSF